MTTTTYPQGLIDAVATKLSEWDGKDNRRVVDGVTYHDLDAIAILDAVREHAAPTPDGENALAVDVPELPDAWWTYEITKRDGHIEADIWLADEDETILSGVGASPTEALAAAIADAVSKGGEG